MSRLAEDFSKWTTQINEGNYEEKKAAAAELAKVGTQEAIDNLWRVLGDREYDVRQAVGDALYEVLKGGFVDQFFKTLRFRRGPVRRGALETIARHRLTTALYRIPKFRLLQDRYHIVKQAAVFAVGEIGTAQNSAMLAPLSRDENAYVRAAVMEGLGKLGDVSKADILVTGLSDIHIEVQRKASAALWRLILPDREPPRPLKNGVTPVVTPLVELLKSSNDTSRRLAAFALGVVNDADAVDPLVGALKDENSRVRQAASFSLGKLGDIAAVVPLMEILHDEDPLVRAAAATALGKIGDPQAVPVLLELLEDKDHMIQKAVISALALLKDKRAIEAFLQAIRSKDEAIREIAALGIQEIGDMQAIRSLIADLKSNDRNLRRRVAEALGKIDNDEAIEPLIAVLQEDSEPMVQSAAAIALGQMRAGGAFDVFSQCLQDENAIKSVRLACAQGLGMLQDTKAIPLLLRFLMDTSRDIRQAVAEAVRRLGGRTVVETQLQRLETGSEEEKNQAKNILGTLGDPRAILPLVQKCTSMDEEMQEIAINILTELRSSGTVDNLAALAASKEEHDKGEAEEILREIKAPATMAILADLTKGEKTVTREIAAYYLGVFGDQSIFPVLEALLNDEDPAVQQTAQKAIEIVREIGQNSPE